MATESDFKRVGNYARMYNPDHKIDRRELKRVMPMEVICPGYSRTGTLTMHKAMEILGYPCYHFSSICENVKDSEVWMEAINAKYYGRGPMPSKEYFDGILGHVSAVTDAPTNLFTEELIEFYPDAKVVLVERDIDKWYKSWMAYCNNAYNTSKAKLASQDSDFLAPLSTVGGAITKAQAGWADDVDQARVRSRNAYRHHYRDIREMVPKDRLLEFNLSGGWQPLCDFLGKPIPDEPFPHENDSQANTQAFREFAQKAMKNIAARNPS